MDRAQGPGQPGATGGSAHQRATGYRDRVEAAKRTASAVAAAARAATHAASAAAAAARHAFATDALARRVHAEREVAARALRIKESRHAAALQREERLNAQESAGFAVDLDDDEYVA